MEARESAWVEWRLLELAEQPTAAAATFDLAQLREIHRRLFQDVYPWAGETRTVQMSRPGQGPGFFDWQGIEEGFEQIQDRLAQSNYLRGASRSDFVTEATEIYNAVNTMHAFREGNGRTQREWVTDLARGAGYDLDWTRVHGFTNDVASRRAREGDLTALRKVIETVATPRTETRSDPSEPGSKPRLRQVPPARARDVQGPRPEEPHGPTHRH